MHFKKTISFIPDSTDSLNIIQRTAVRALIMEEGKILMVRSNLGYYKLPGGGVDEGESRAEALQREVAEETGYLSCSIIEELGLISEKRPDYSEPDSYFHMDSYHYICRLDNKDKIALTLIGYELEEGYTPVWISIKEALDANTTIYESDKNQIFIPRENFVLDWLQVHKASIELKNV